MLEKKISRKRNLMSNPLENIKQNCVVYVRKPVVPVFFSKEFLKKETTSEKSNLEVLNKEGFLYSLNVIITKLDTEDIIAASFLFHHVKEAVKPFLTAEIFKEDKMADFCAFLSYPVRLFKKHETNIFILEGCLTQKEITQKITEWTESLVTKN